MVGSSKVHSIYPHPDLISGEDKPFIRNIFTLNSCSHIVGSQVLSFREEKEMLEQWREFVAQVDPDVVIGYNVANFDFPYLMDRAKALKANNFPYLGRLRGSCWTCSSFGFVFGLIAQVQA